MQRQMQDQNIQSEITEKEAKFEKEIKKKNKAQKEFGMIVKAINNILCQSQKQKNRRKEGNRDTDPAYTENIDVLVERLNQARENIEDLSKTAELADRLEFKALRP